MSAIYKGRSWDIDHDRIAQVSNAQLRYAVLGEGEPVLLIHGTNLCDSLVSGLTFYEPLTKDYRIISYYRAGYNGSTLAKDSLTIEEMADHMKELLDHLGIEKAHIVGYSFGGVVAFQFLLKYPERAHTAALLEPYFNRESEDAIKANMDIGMAAWALFQAGDKRAAVKTFIAGVWGPTMESAVELSCPLDEFDRAERSADITFLVDGPALWSWGFKMSEADKYVDQKPKMPFLAVLGTDSESILPGFLESQRFMMDWIPQAERAGIPHATHGMQSQNPHAVGQAVHEFIRKYPMTGSGGNVPA